MSSLCTAALPQIAFVTPVHSGLQSVCAMQTFCSDSCDMLFVCMCSSVLRKQNDSDMAFHIAAGCNGISKENLKVGCFLSLADLSARKSMVVKIQDEPATVCMISMMP